MTRYGVCAVVVALVGSAAARSGSFLDIAECTEDEGCTLGVPQTFHPNCEDCIGNPDDPCCHVTPFGITHPLGYTGAETSLQLRLCVEAEDSELVPAVERSIATWEALAPSIENCHGCVLVEETPPALGRRFVDTVALHEIGHCALALDHVNRLWDADNNNIFEDTSFTRSANAAHPGGIDAGPDGIRGSNDDTHTAPGGTPADSVSWFRIADNDPNDPFVVDATVIDINTYSRSTSNLPAGHSWGANANRLVGESLGYSASQSPMYSQATLDQFYSALGADDVNMISMGMTGEDLTAGTADDYTISLVYVGDCSNAHDIRVYLDVLDPGVLGGCTLKEIDYSFLPGNPLLARHFSLVEVFPGVPFEVIINELVPWDFGGPIFLDGFESGDTSEWSLVVTDGSEISAEQAAEDFAMMEAEGELIELLEEQGLLEEPPEP